MSFRSALVGFLVVVLAALAVTVAPANAGKPKSGNWFSAQVDPKDEDNLSSIQFKVIKGKKLKQLTIYWKCGKKSGYHSFTNLPIPIGIHKKRFKVIGQTEPPSGQPPKDFKLKGRFVSGKKARYTMKLQRCGPETTGKLEFV